MASGLSLEARLQIIVELFLVARNSEFINTANTPKVIYFSIIQTILDDNTYRCNVRQRVISILRKSPVWEKLKPFLVNNDSHCARKGCGCGDYWHNNGACDGSHYRRNKLTNKWESVNCQCPGFVKKTF